jgi:hypothetical protein
MTPNAKAPHDAAPGGKLALLVQCSIRTTIISGAARS